MFHTCTFGDGSGRIMACHICKCPPVCRKAESTHLDCSCDRSCRPTAGCVCPCSARLRTACRQSERSCSASPSVDLGTHSSVHIWDTGLCSGLGGVVSVPGGHISQQRFWLSYSCSYCVPLHCAECSEDAKGRPHRKARAK